MHESGIGPYGLRNRPSEKRKAVCAPPTRGGVDIRSGLMGACTHRASPKARQAVAEECGALRHRCLDQVGFPNPSFPRRRTYDHVLAVTLKSQGVTEFYTRNGADFRTAGFTDVVNPID